MRSAQLVIDGLILGVSARSMAYDAHNDGAYKHDPAMEDDSMHNTITASSMQQRQGSGEHRPQTSYSDTGFSRPYHSAEGTPDAQYRWVEPVSLPNIDPMTDVPPGMRMAMLITYHVRARD